MLETNANQDFNFQVLDSTVFVNPGTARVGNTIMSFRGDSIPFQQLVNYGTVTSGYQYSALVIQDLNSHPSLAGIVSPPAATIPSLSYPILASDSTNPYSPVHPIGLFLFDTTDGVSFSLVSSQRING